jgi:hypothetical protein
VTRRATPALLTVVATVTAAGLLAGCGIDAESSVRSLPGSDRSASATPSASRPATQATTLWMVNNDKLVRVLRRMPPDPSVDEVIRRLAIGPTEEERGRGLRTAVGFADLQEPADPASTPEPTPAGDEQTGTESLLLSGTEAANIERPAVVTVSDEFRDLPASEQLLAIGQYVLSLTASNYTSVAFVASDGSPLAVPAPGGQLLDRPLTADDYATLRARP